jgi:hypothetical protein
MSNSYEDVSTRCVRVLCEFLCKHVYVCGMYPTINFFGLAVSRIRWQVIRNHTNIIFLIAEARIERASAGHEPAVLPLHHPAGEKLIILIHNLFRVPTTRSRTVTLLRLRSS